MKSRMWDMESILLVALLGTFIGVVIGGILGAFFPEQAQDPGIGLMGGIFCTLLGEVIAFSGASLMDAHL